jgi:hypothetical protein
MELLSPLSLRHVCGLVLWLSLQNKSLYVHPTQSFGCESFVLFGLCLIVLKEEYADKEVEEEETTNQDENDEEDHPLEIEFLLGTLSFFGHIEGVDHDVWPTFKTGDDEESSHSITDIIKVMIKNRPLTSSSFAFNLGMKPVHIN